jgi:excisionase family DNA binding protein
MLDITKSSEQGGNPVAPRVHQQSQNCRYKDGAPVSTAVGLVQEPDEPRKLLTPAEVAQLFRVDPKTVTRWAKAGKLASIRTLGGHRRYAEDEVEALIRESQSGSY